MHLGFTEILLILAVALLVLGPDKFPKFMTKIGGALKDLKKYTGELTEDIKENVIEPLDEAQKPLREALAPIEELNQSIKDNVKEIEDGLKGKSPKKDEASQPEKKVEAPAASTVAEATEEKTDESEAPSEYKNSENLGEV